MAFCEKSNHIEPFYKEGLALLFSEHFTALVEGTTQNTNRNLCTGRYCFTLLWDLPSSQSPASSSFEKHIYGLLDTGKISHF